MVVVWLTSRSVDTFTFNVETSQMFHAHTSRNEWVVNFGFTHNMEKDASLFSSLDTATKKKISMADDFSLDIIVHVHIPCRQGWIVNVYHVPTLKDFFFSISYLTQISNIVEFWLY